MDRNHLVVQTDNNNDIITDAYRQAKYEVESAENETVRILFDTSKKGESNPSSEMLQIFNHIISHFFPEVLSPVELLRLTRFPRGEGRFIARPAEIYERALSIIKEQLEKGMRINVTSKQING